MEGKDQPAPGNLTSWQSPPCFTYDGVLYPEVPFTKESLEKLRAGEVTECDVLIAGYPRSGTSRLVEICWLLLHGCDTEKAKAVNQVMRHMVCELNSPPIHPYDLIEPPIVAKTHVHFNVAGKLVEKAERKVIVAIRNPKDVLVSWYHFNRMNVLNGLFPGNWHQFMALYRQGKLTYGDYFDHVLSWWAQRERPNVMVITYEDLNENPLDYIQKISAFLGTEQTEKELQAVAEWVSFSNMQQQPSTNHKEGPFATFLRSDISTYMRCGGIGDWKNYFNEEENKYIDDLCKERCAPAGLDFRFE